MNCVGDRLPPGNLLRRMYAGRADVADALWTHLGSFGDEQPGGCALCVISRVKRIWDIALGGAAARHWRHHRAVSEFELAQLKGREKIFGFGLEVRGDGLGLSCGSLMNGHCCAP